MKVKFSIIKTCCITMHEAVTVPNVMMMSSIVSEESLAKHTNTHTHTHSLTHSHTHNHTHIAIFVLNSNRS